MEPIEEMWRILKEPGGEVFVMYLVAVVFDEHGVSIRIAAQEPLLKAWIEIADKASLHRSLEVLCDGLKPPDDRPRGKNIKIKRFLLSTSPGETPNAD